MARYIRPTIDTKFHIDFSWWEAKGQNLRAYLVSHSCPACGEQVRDSDPEVFDWISPETGEIFQIDILWHLIHTHCSQEPDYLDSRVPLTSAIFRSFIINNNSPLTPVELHNLIPKKSPDLILNTIGRHQVYKGIKPVDLTV